MHLYILTEYVALMNFLVDIHPFLAKPCLPQDSQYNRYYHKGPTHADCQTKLYAGLVKQISRLLLGKRLSIWLR